MKFDSETDGGFIGGFGSGYEQDDTVTVVFGAAALAVGSYIIVAIIAGVLTWI